MQKNILLKQESNKTEEKVDEKPPETPRDFLIKVLGFRGLEVLENAESQFPNETKLVVGKLSDLIKSGEIAETLDGGKLLALFRSIGLNIRMATKINVEQDGKFVSLSDKLSNQLHDDDDGDRKWA